MTGKPEVEKQGAFAATRLLQLIFTGRESGNIVPRALTTVLAKHSIHQGLGLLSRIQKKLHLLQCFIKRYLKGSVAWPQANEAQLMLQPAIDYFQIGPAQHLLAP